jgi:hypothetical protein
MVRWRDEIGERRAKAGNGIGLGPTLAGVAVFFLASILFNGESLWNNARSMPYGRIRDISLRLTLPLQQLSRGTGLNRFRQWIENTWNKENPQ